METPDTRIPVTIITGFLGSGKTTLLNQLIKKHPEKKFAIIENEFGEIGIDGGLIVGATDNIFELSNGCICCSLNDDFYKVLEKLLDSPYPFNHLLVETTGIADPMTVVKSFLSDEDVQMQFRIDSVICLADAINMEDLMNTEPEVRRQIALSDIVLINKTDCVQKDYVQELTSIISGISPMAQIYPVTYGNVSQIQILDTFAYSGQQIEQSTRSFQNLMPTKTSTTGTAPLATQQKNNAHRHDIVSEGFSIPGRFRFGMFNFWMQNFLYLNNDTVFRIKGIVNFDDRDEKLIFHAVRGNYVFERGTPWADCEMPFNKLVFIGKNLNREELENNLYQLLG
jgi:G3E family GTPase